MCEICPFNLVLKVQNKAGLRMNLVIFLFLVSVLLMVVKIEIIFEDNL